MEIRLISNEDLSLDDIPSGAIGDEALGYFAQSFDGPAIWGRQRGGQMANGWREHWEASRQLPDTLTELRGCLFFEQRRRNAMSPEIDDEQLEYEGALLARLRDKLDQGVTDDEQATVEAWMRESPDPGVWDNEHVRSILGEAVEEATKTIPDAIAARDGTYGLERDLRDGVVRMLRDRGELVLTEAKIGVPDWTSNLGGFDLSLVDATGELAVAETKWADGNLWESIWDLLKLASAATMPRVCAAFAIYGAPLKHWEKPAPTADLFSGGIYHARDVIENYPKQWRECLAGSTARPRAVPLEISIDPVSSSQVEVGGKPWLVNLVEVIPGGVTTWLEEGWPPDTQPAA